MVTQFKITIFWGDDFSCILDANLDRSSTTNYSLSNMSIALAHNTQELDLCEIWRTIHSSDRDFSFYSSVHNSYLIKNLFFLCPFIFCLQDIKMCLLSKSINRSSRTIFSIDFDGPLASPKSWRFNRTLLANQQFIEYINAHLDIFAAMHQDSTVCSSIVWDTLKAYIRGIIITFSSSLKTKSKDELQHIEQEIKKL